MAKYYVKSGQIRFVIDCSDHICAILAALSHYKGQGVMTSTKICVGEKGFDSFKEWKCYDTDKFLKDT